MVADVLVLSVDDREAWIRGHVDLAAAQSAMEAVDDRWLVTYLAHVRGHYGFGVNEDGDFQRGCIHIDPTRTGPGWFPVTIATLRRVRLDE